VPKGKYESHVEPRFKEIEHWRTVEGLTEVEIAKMLNIGYSTLKGYKNKYPAFLAMLKRSKITLVSELEKSLFKLAMGFTEDKYYAPNVTALVFALTNLDPDNWSRNTKDDAKTEEHAKKTPASEATRKKNLDDLLNKDVPELEE